MDFTRLALFVAAGLFLLEGCSLALFPAQVKEILTEADPRALQVAGFVETILAAVLVLAALRG